ncbi:MAG: hypothetical protein QME52_14470, partial [Bacteroidota bacterium]|nr:hypothetical protein [Bacteroidota bacterium]
MNTKRFIPLFLTLIIFFANKGNAQYLLLDSTLTVSSPMTFDSVRILSNGNLVADDSIAVLGNMMIDSGGVITHSQRLLSGLRLNVLGTLEIKSGGMIDVNGKGLLGGHRGGLFRKSGETYGSGDTIV